MTEPAAAALNEALAAAGFFCLGGFVPKAEDDIPALSDGRVTQTLLLIGSTGPSIWPVLTASPEYQDGKADPLDRYTKRTLLAVADPFGFEALFPFEGPPYHPFQQWALNCGGFSRSPMGVLAHRHFGPWAGFRAVFLVPELLAGLTTPPGQGPCENCTAKPCLPACPVEALSLTSGYDVPKCRDYLAASPEAPCRTGCLARRACPVGDAYRPGPDMGRFHMDRFVSPNGF
ncbi:hypothetical protein [Roseibium sp. M-1]